MADAITLTIDGRSASVAAGTTVAAAIAVAAATTGAVGVTRRSLDGHLRAPLCGMGVCQECRVSIDGRAHVLSCQTLCQPGMDVRTGAAA
jgi:predicted molibdopterin-dependent oxidoreductase YjgC